MPEWDEPTLSHVTDAGQLRMVDVSSKDVTRRVATASCRVVTDRDVFALAPVDAALSVTHAARLAGIQAAKRTAAYVPLCHPLDLHDVHVDVSPHPSGVDVLASVVTVSRTGVEMEALTACLFAALSLVSALQDVDASSCIVDLHLLSKSGGQSAAWGRDANPPETPFL